MATPLSLLLARKALDASKAYERLVLVVGGPRTGKTTALRELKAEYGWPVFNLNLVLAERLLDLTSRQRPLALPALLAEVVSQEEPEVVLLDNLELLFHPDLKQDPLRLLKGVARTRTVVATWRGRVADGALLYAEPPHPEHRRYPRPEVLTVDAGSLSPGMEAAQEHTS